MGEFKREITIVVEGESSKELSDEELFNKLNITVKDWWQNPNWPYGKPCKQLLGMEVEKISLKPKI